MPAGGVHLHARRRKFANYWRRRSQTKPRGRPAIQRAEERQMLCVAYRARLHCNSEPLGGGVNRHSRRNAQSGGAPLATPPPEQSQQLAAAASGARQRWPTRDGHISAAARHSNKHDICCLKLCSILSCVGVAAAATAVSEATIEQDSRRRGRARPSWQRDSRNSLRRRCA